MINMVPTKNGMNQVFPNETQSLFTISSETPTRVVKSGESLVNDRGRTNSTK